MAGNLENEPQVRTVGRAPSYSATALRLLHNNNGLTESDAELISEDLARGEHSLSLLGAEISSVQNSMDQLSKEYNEKMAIYQQQLAGLNHRKRQIIAFVDAHRRIISPFRTNYIPPEILAEIFAFAAELNVTDNPKNGVWRFGRVCSFWRRTLLDHPRLWSRIFIVHSLKKSLPAIIAEILLRSKQVPLDIVLSLRPNGFSLYDDDLPSLQNDPVILPILAVSKRWRSLAIHGGRLGFLASIRGHVPLLRQMTLTNCALPTTFDCVEVAPSLTDVRVYGSSIVFPNVRFPWSQLRFCALPCSDPSAQLEILRRCPDLQTFSLGPYAQEVIYNVSDDVISNIITVGLRRLALTKSNSSYLLPNLKLPSLETVSINAAIVDDDVNRRLKSLIDRSHCPVSTLEVDIKSSQWIKLASLLLKVPFHSLKTLEISGNVHCKQVADILTLRAGNPITFPHLTRFSVRGGMELNQSPQFLQEQFTSVVEMARSRCNVIPGSHENVATLESLVFYVYAPSTDGYPEHLAGILKPLQCLHAQGLVVEVDPFFLEAIPE